MVENELEGIGKDGKGTFGGSGLRWHKIYKEVSIIKAAELRLSGVYCEYVDVIS